ncbi:uncharacterized protein LOC129721175 isoform X2 [Wyeomyia smithii]|uniref:uncharacterized protein LOC129721175 isoform X2 n=1 Tax=Wyeomyia smithii TaxID=174621 RepID=UPI002468070A|nr:uncharacterized protein LOC129721175 isoform X2 [Wyeomyia smithii]
MVLAKRQSNQCFIHQHRIASITRGLLIDLNIVQAKQDGSGRSERKELLHPELDEQMATSSSNAGRNYDEDVSGSTIVNYHDIYVQQTGSNQSELDSIATMNSNPTSPPSYNQVPTEAGTNRSSSVVTSVHVSCSGGNRRGEPPSYEEAINPDAPPPSYDSLFGRVREAHKSSTGMLDFLKNVTILLLGTLGCTIILGITIVIPVCMIVFGAIYLHDCPQNDYIPVFLLVGGVFSVLKQLLHLSTRVRSREGQEFERLRQSPTQTLINCFMLGWFIIGSFWIYRIYEPNYDPALGKYCNKSLYLFTFWLITSVYMTLGIITVVLCGVSIISIAIHRRT